MALKVIGLEEHFATADVIAGWRALDPRWQDVALAHSTEGPAARRLLDTGAARIAAMDDAGVDVQVMSLTTPGVATLPTADAVALQSATNDVLADAVGARPDRLQGLATLATSAPEQAAAELERAVRTLGLNGALVFGHARDGTLDDPWFWPVFEAAAALRAPVYLHPQSPPRPVRQSYYGGFEASLNDALATHGIGWHYDAGILLLRLILRGVFDRFPELQIVVGHWGEMVLFYLDRIDALQGIARLARPPSEYFRTNVMVTPSGIFSQRYLRWAAEVIGIERIMFATDYPFVCTEGGAARRFLDEAADLTDEQREAVAVRNWERVCARIRR